MTQDKQSPPVFQLFSVSEAADALHLHLSKARASSGTCPHRQGSRALWPQLGYLPGRPGGLPSHASPAGEMAQVRRTAALPVRAGPARCSRLDAFETFCHDARAVLRKRNGAAPAFFSSIGAGSGSCYNPDES